MPALKGKVAKQKKGWQELCRQLAMVAAQEEARKVWKVQANVDLPFNHRWEHVQAVVRMSLLLARMLEADLEVAEAAAWLHDVAKGQPNHGLMGAKEARKLLEKSDFPVEKIPAVLDAIAKHVGLYRPEGAPPIEPLAAAILWDADKLTKLGMQALAYNLSMSFMRGLALSQRRENNAEFTRNVLRHTVASMNTAPAQAIAERRLAAMEAALQAWEAEDDETE